MDLDYHGRQDLSEHLIRAFIGESGDQELIEVLCAEILQISESAAEILNVATAQQSESAIRNEALLSYAEQIERLADASEAVGFAGLQQVCAHINANLLASF